MNQKYLKRIVAQYVRDKEVPYLKSIRAPKDVVEQFNYLSTRDREEFVSIHLDKGNQLLCWDRVSIGGLSEALVSAREVVKTALLSNAASLILVHCHPSGRTGPSEEDRTMTQKLAEAAQLFSIKILDHIIIGNDSAYFSFQEHGLL
jgi:DNA repair protein RadC